MEDYKLINTFLQNQRNSLRNLYDQAYDKGYNDGIEKERQSNSTYTISEQTKKQIKTNAQFSLMNAIYVLVNNKEFCKFAFDTEDTDKIIKDFYPHYPLTPQDFIDKITNSLEDFYNLKRELEREKDSEQSEKNHCCESCKYESLASCECPCSNCSHSHIDWWKEKEDEDDK